MAEPTNELILRVLTQIQETLSLHTRLHEDHARHFEKLGRSIEDIRRTGSTALGFAMHANIRHEAVDERIAVLEREFGTLEDLKRRVGQLEQAK